jgi:hypothetical protein
MPRYDPAPNTAEAFRKIISDLQRQISDLQNSPTTRSVVKDAYNAVTDDAGVVRVEWGKLPDGKYGIRVHNAAGTVTFDQSGV